jgi:UDP-N-acetylglucosamine 2-epimerase (non-hydrolysing)
MAKPISVLAFVGTRPEAIKMAPLMIAMAAQQQRFRANLCVTGQHRQMLEQALRAFNIRPDYVFSVMTENQRLGGLTAKIIENVERVLAENNPDIVLVQGDTTTAFAAALTAFYNRIPVGHVEAGLRTHDLYSPFPEEANRVLTDRIATLCFAPTLLNRDNLLTEGVPTDRIFVTGNTGIDALRIVCARVSGMNPAAWSSDWGSAHSAVVSEHKPIVMITAHRRESFGAGMREIFSAIRKLAERNKSWNFVYPVHLNPNVREPAVAILGRLSNVFLIEPLDYEPFVYLMQRSTLILTDSGGIQEEAPSLCKPVVVMRAKTERQEAVQAGTVILAGIRCEDIIDHAQRIMDKVARGEAHSIIANPYGDGHAAESILAILAKSFADK